MKKGKTVVSAAIGMIVVMTVLCGFIYPLIVTGISQLLFKERANGSIITVDGVNYGCEQLAQEFTGEEYLWGRIMIADTDTFTDEAGNPLYYAKPSNLSPASKEYETIVTGRIEDIKKAHPSKEGEKIPVDLVTVSGSGLDPQISVNAATYQIDRIAQSRGISADTVEKIIEKYTTHKLLGMFGEEVVNVLKVNLALDGIL